MKNVIMAKDGEHNFTTWIKKRIRNNLNFLAIAEGQTGCLLENTIIEGQKKSIGDLYKEGKRYVLAYSIAINKNKNRYVKKTVAEIINSGKKEVYKITLENGKRIYATKEHKLFKLKKNKFVKEEVRNLKVGDYLNDFPEGYGRKVLEGLNERTKKITRERRQKELEEVGFEVIRFTDKQINNNFKGVKQCIKQKLNQ